MSNAFLLEQTCAYARETITFRRELIGFFEMLTVVVIGVCHVFVSVQVAVLQR